MKRPIKFRAWHRKWGEMVYSTDKPAFGTCTIYPCILEMRTSHYPTEGWRIMQYTGLNDHKGTPIYEGDILRCTHWFFDGNAVDEVFIASVGFRDGSFTLENIRSRYYADYTGEENGKGVCWIGAINWDESDYEVIGNIHENPELLKANAR